MSRGVGGGVFAERKGARSIVSSGKLTSIMESRLSSKGKSGSAFTPSSEGATQGVSASPQSKARVSRDETTVAGGCLGPFLPVGSFLENIKNTCAFIFFFLGVGATRREGKHPVVSVGVVQRRGFFLANATRC